VRARLGAAHSLQRLQAQLQLSPVARVWLLNAAILGGLALVIGAVGGSPAQTRPIALTWWELGLAFLVAETFVVHVRFRRNTHTFSLNEIPLVLGLYFAAPAELLAGVVVGSGLALIVNRRQSLLKLVFNMAQLALTAGVAVFVFIHLRPAQPLQPTSWLAAIAAVAAASLLSVALTTAAIHLAEGRADIGKRVEVLLVGLGSGVCTTSLALIAVRMIWVDPSALALLMVPVGTMFIAYRAYLADRQRHEEIGHLYEVSRTFQESDGVDATVRALLAQSARMFRAERVDVLLFSPDEGGAALRSVAHRDEVIEVMQPFDPARAANLLDELQSRSAVLMDTPQTVARLTGGLIEGVHRNGLAVALRVETRFLGLVLLLDRPVEVGNFNSEHLKLLETVAGHAAVAFAKGRLEEQLRYRAFHDPLTHLANRALFADRLEHALSRRRRSKRKLAVLFVDIDDFKVVNDIRGHAVGDQLLASFAERLRACLRPDDTAARFGGDEFVILLEDVSATNQAVQIAERIATAVQVPFVFAGFELRLGVSVGIAPGGTGHAAEDLIASADAAMYAAKKLGKGRHIIFEDSMREAALERYSLIGDLRDALARGEFVLRFQPIDELAGGRTVAVETLVRWQHPVRGLLGPDSFIPLAEETGQVLDLDLWILEEACRNLVEWTRSGWGADLSITVNVSGSHFLSRTYASQVAGILARTALDPQRLTLEMTEGVMVADLEAAAAELQPLRAQGVKLAIDDFGTGYSSLASLQRFPVDVIKIAKPFVDRLGEGAQAETFLRAIMSLAGALELTVIAEGVENGNQARQLQSLGCQLGQGYFLSWPLEASQLEERLRGALAGGETLAG
jgi:diguanylate cyclase (GGDEF)-like protein